jgi:hypothetical protein
MKLIEPEIHVHKFVKLGKKKITVHKVVGKGAIETAIDLILFRQCACGKKQAYDLQRTLI